MAEAQETLTYGPEDYETFPKLYVEGVESSEYLVPDLERLTYTIHASPPPGSRAFGKAIYEEAWDLVLDPVAGRARRAFALVMPWRGGEALLVEAGVRLYLIEAHGTQVVFTAREGDEVGERDVLAYVLTGKGETRTLRAGVSGVVVLIAWERGSHPPRYAIAIAEHPDVVRLRRA